MTSGPRLPTRLEAARAPIHPPTVDFRELEELPSPVRRYFRRVLREGQPMIAAVSIRHRGSLNMSEVGERWKPITSEQRVITRRPGFDWNARIALMPGLSVHVRDAYVAGEGILTARLLGLIPLANLRGAGEIARGELMRFLAETAWYPTALLPSQGVSWRAVDQNTADATLADGPLRVTMRFMFDEEDLIRAVQAEARGRTVSGRIVPTPWRGRFADHAERDGMLVPLEGEAEWLLPEGARPYWRGTITAIDHELTEHPAA
ncbi:MAG: hypothetical protein DIU56_015540 [Pseudomonadota bacterium]